MNAITQQGWTCPKCTRVWAPHIAACGPCNQGIASWGPNRFGTPALPYPWHATCRQVTAADVHPEWNFNGDDLSYKHQDGDPA